MATLAFNHEEIAARALKPRLYELDVESRESVEAHYKLYQGYVAKRNEILGALSEVDLSSANQVYSEIRAQGRPHVCDRRDQESRDLLRASRRRRRRSGRGDRRPDRARPRPRPGTGRPIRRRRAWRAGRGRPTTGTRVASLQLRRRHAKHLSDLERDAADRARRLRRVLPRLPDRPRVLHRGVLREPTGRLSTTG